MRLITLAVPNPTMLSLLFAVNAMDGTPRFRCTPSGDLILRATAEAKSVRLSSAFLAKSPEEDRKEAVKRVVSHGGDPENEALILSQSNIQFGKYRGLTFQWLLENDIGWAVSLVTSHRIEREKSKSMNMYMINKDMFSKFACSFPSFAAAVQYRQAQNEATLSAKVGNEDARLVGFGVYKANTWKELYDSNDKEKQG